MLCTMKHIQWDASVQFVVLFSVSMPTSMKQYSYTHNIHGSTTLGHHDIIENIRVRYGFRRNSHYLHEATWRQRSYRRQRSTALVHFRAFQRVFIIEVHRHWEFFQNGFAEVKLFGRNTSYPMLSRQESLFGQFYKGNVVGDPLSMVHCQLINNNIFIGAMRTSGHVYHVELAAKYFNHTSRNAHVIYKSDKILEMNVTTRHQHEDASNSSKLNPSNRGSQQNSRAKRASWSERNTRKTCTVALIADYILYEHFQKFSRQHGISTIAAITGEMIQHIIATDLIYRAADFNQDGTPDSIGLAVNHVGIFTSRSLEADKYLSKYLGDQEVHTTSSFTYAVSSYPVAAVNCLSLAFLFRSFGNVLGSFIRADAKSVQSSIGGICTQPYSGYTFNGGFVTLKAMDGFMVPRSRRETENTVIHEMGHAFGSFHDEDHTSRPECTNDYGGRYVMSQQFDPASITTNSRLFSPCSLETIHNVVYIRGPSCLLVGENSPSCGNFRVDDGEQCDCGSRQHAECHKVDTCCEPGCLLKSGADCSPTKHACCSGNCKIFASKENVKCQPETDCFYGSYCNGSSLQCPARMPKDNGIRCDKHKAGYAFCYQGHCIKDICKAHGMSKCQCYDIAENMCKLCCRKTTGDCVLAERLNINTMTRLPFNIPDGDNCSCNCGTCQLHTCISINQSCVLRTQCGNPASTRTSYTPHDTMLHDAWMFEGDSRVQTDHMEICTVHSWQGKSKSQSLVTTNLSNMFLCSLLLDISKLTAKDANAFIVLVHRSEHLLTVGIVLFTCLIVIATVFCFLVAKRIEKCHCIEYWLTNRCDAE